MDTFVVRIWGPAEHEPVADQATLCGVVEHLASRRRRTFADEHGLVSFLTARVGTAKTVDVELERGTS